MSELLAQKWVYIGKRTGNKFKFVDGWRRFTDDGKLIEGEDRFFKSGREHRVVGGIYNVKANAEGTKMLVVDYSGESFGNKEQVAQWRLDQDVAKTAAQLEDAEKLARNDELELLRPLQRRYLNATSQQRMAIEVQVLGYLRMTRVSP